VDVGGGINTRVSVSYDTSADPVARLSTGGTWLAGDRSEVNRIVSAAAGAAVSSAATSAAHCLTVVGLSILVVLELGGTPRSEPRCPTCAQSHRRLYHIGGDNVSAAN
jgi:hypothetical protein